MVTAGKWFVFAGEYLNKGKLGETGSKEHDKFILWDVLVWQGKYLIGSTLQERLDLLQANYPCERIVVNQADFEMYEHLCIS